LDSRGSNRCLRQWQSAQIAAEFCGLDSGLAVRNADALRCSRRVGKQWKKERRTQHQRAKQA
jgi:hypothetical protein